MQVNEDYAFASNIYKNLGLNSSMLNPTGLADFHSTILAPTPISPTLTSRVKLNGIFAWTLNGPHLN